MKSSLVYLPMRKKVQRSQETKGIVDAIGVKKKRKESRVEREPPPEQEEKDE